MQEINGRTAIEAHLNRLYKGAAGYILEDVKKDPAQAGNPLEDILIFKHQTDPVHWHYITFGLTELYDKETQFEDISGFGFELTFRLLANPKDKQPPSWAKHFLQNIARYVFESGEGFDDYHFMDAGGVICQDEPTDLTAIAFITDAELSEISTSNGKVKFLQVIGITQEEMKEVEGENYMEFFNRLQKGNPLLITDLKRKSIAR